MEPLFPNYVYVPWKAEYVRQRKKIDGCLICTLIKDPDTTIICHEIGRNELFFVFLNLFPYNPGHLLIATIKHYEKYAIDRENRPISAVSRPGAQCCRQ